MENQELRALVASLARQVAADPDTIGVLSTGEACAAALVLGRLDLLAAPYNLSLIHI